MIIEYVTWLLKKDNTIGAMEYDFFFEVRL